MSLPLWLSRPDDLAGHALEIWKAHAPGLKRAGKLNAGNAEMLRALVRLLALADQCSAEIEAGGVVLRNGAGVARSNPAVGTMLRAQNEARPLLKFFGLAEEGQ